MQNGCPIAPPGEVGLTGLWFSGSPFVPFLRTGVALAFFQCSGTSPGLHGLSKVLESGLAATSAASALAGASRGAHALVAVRFV